MPKLPHTAAFLTLSAALAGCAPMLTDPLSALNGGLNPARRLSVAQPSPTTTAGALTLTSAAFTNGSRYPEAQVANGFGCTGQNLSPALNWTGLPVGTKSLVLTVYDPDAPTGSGFWHWLVYNIPPTATGLPPGAGSPGGALPAGAVQLPTDTGQPGFAGACPPPGDPPHRYVFTLYALDRTLDLPPETRPPVLGFTLNGAVLAKTSLTATYGR